MASLRVLLFCLVFFLLKLQTSAKNDAPCQPSKWNNGYKTFIKRHIRSGTPNSYDEDEWKAYIKTHGGCDRPTQSFLLPKDLDRVRAVCSSGGGQVYQENLCISRQPFKFVTVRSEPQTCSIRSVKAETKHLILACEVLENQCLPVHFEGNPEGLRPDNNARGCQDPDTRGDAAALRTTWLWMLSAVIFIIYAY
uniref:Ribonuclease A-domain domain-containing protein n=1 Tax=Acanthochromis polyacanthus TaxID=80966 RepID=A0A3Q1FN41_9TELE